MPSTRHAVDLRYTQAELLALFDAAERQDVEGGGRYDRRGAAIIIWSHSWTTAAMRHDSDILGTLHVHWGDENRVYQLDCETGFEVVDLLHELAALELAALGYSKHGSKQF